MNTTYQYYRNRKVFTLIDIIVPIVIVLLIIATLATMITPIGSTVEIYLDGQLYGSYALSNDCEIVVENGDNYNKVIIANQKVSVVDANCNNQLCMHHSSINLANQQIICAPNGMVVIIKNNNAEVDGITGGRQ